ncbi:MAG TPA: phosphodiester glycosidase family protein, partial [Clostridia bacterium]
MKTKKILAAVLTIIFIMSIINTYVEADIISGNVENQTIAPGVTLKHDVRFTDEGWLDIYVLCADTATNSGITVDSILNPNLITNLSNVKTLAESKGAVAAINGCFFNFLNDRHTVGYPDGPIVESGKIATAYSEYDKYQDSMSSFSIDNAGKIQYDFWKTDISLQNLSGAAIHVGQYNKPSCSKYTDVTIVDRTGAENSIGATAQYPDMVEMVVDMGVVTEIRTAQPAATIPEKGFVVSGRQDGGKLITDNFKVGDRVQMDIKTTPDWKGLKMSMTGSAMLLKDGSIPGSFSFEIAGRLPRTAIGSSKDGSKVYFVTVDGRQNSSIGMTQLEFAQYLLSIGVYNALNLDGGGSTTMVARKPGTSDLEIKNSPSDGVPRMVSSAIGVFLNTVPAELDSLLIDTVDHNIFVNTSRELIVKGMDRNMNPVNIDTEKISWSVSGVDGTFSGNRFYPRSTGQGKITAKLGDMSADIDINVIEKPVMLELSKRSVALAGGQTVQVGISGKDRSGYHAVISADDATFTPNNINIDIDKGNLTGTTPGSGYVDVSIGGIHAYFGVSVSSDGSVKAPSEESLPKDTLPVDEDAKITDYNKTSDSIMFSVTGQSGKPRNFLEKVLSARYLNKALDYDINAFVGDADKNMVNTMKTPVLATSSNS